MEKDIFPQIEPMSFDEFNKEMFNKTVTTYQSLFKETVYENSSLNEYIKSLEKQLEQLKALQDNKELVFSLSVNEDDNYYSDLTPSYYEVQVHKRVFKKIETPLDEVEKRYSKHLSNHDAINNRRKSDSERYRKHLIWLEENK